MILPPVLSEVEVAENVIGSIDGLLLSGGGDIEPERFSVYDYDASLVGEPSPERDAYELALARRAYEYDLPTLGICRGIQTMASRSAAACTLTSRITSSRSPAPSRRTR